MISIILQMFNFGSYFTQPQFVLLTLCMLMRTENHIDEYSLHLLSCQSSVYTMFEIWMYHSEWRCYVWASGSWNSYFCEFQIGRIFYGIIFILIAIHAPKGPPIIFWSWKPWDNKPSTQVSSLSLHTKFSMTWELPWKWPISSISGSILPTNIETNMRPPHIMRNE